MNQERISQRGLVMKKVSLVIRLSLAGAILSVSLVSLGASLFGYDSSVIRDVVAAFGGGAVTAGIIAKTIGLLA